MTDEQALPDRRPTETPLAVPPASPNDAPKQGGAGRTNPVNWLFCLFFRPGKFFAEYARATPSWLVVICACIFGAAWGLWEHIPEEYRAKLPERGAAGYVLGKTLCYAVVGGAFWYFFAGTWYAFRVSLCRPQDMTPKLARRAFIFSELVYALPAAIGSAIWWIVQDQSFLIATIVVSILFILWSVYISYRAARALFRATRFRAALLFLLLPYLFYGVCFAFPFLLGSASSRLAQVEVPFENAVFTMRRPANWQKFETPGPSAVSFHIPDIGSFLATVKHSEGQPIDLERTAQAAAQGMAAKFSTTAEALGTFPAWGKYSGHGIRVSINGNGKDLVTSIFCASLPDERLLLVMEVGQSNAEAQLQPQFEIARKTLRVKPAK